MAAPPQYGVATTEPPPVAPAPAPQAAAAPTKKRHKYYHPGVRELVGAAVVAAVLAAGSLLLARSHGALGYWTVGRIAGFLIYGLLTVAVSLGLFIALRWRMFGSAWIAAERLHPILLLTAGALLITHVVGFILVGFPVTAAFIPFISGFRQVPIGLGVLSAYVGLLLLASVYVIRLIGFGLWRFFHYLGFVAWACALVHGLAAGHDSGALLALAYYAVGALVVGILLVVRFIRYITSLQPAALRATPSGAGSRT
jgi:sulfoxide reductase heme-binding subunit YedZ